MATMNLTTNEITTQQIAELAEADPEGAKRLLATKIVGKDHGLRHRILMRGGVFMYPRDTKDPLKPGRLRLLYEANPVGMLMEQAGGRASTGREPMMDVVPTSLHQRIGLVFGSKNEVERIERYHRERAQAKEGEPLFASRSLFRD